MTDRYHSLTVVLQDDTRKDDAEELMAAIRMLRGVISVSGTVADPVSHMAHARARQDLEKKLWEALYPATGKP